tara:strand:- start:71 stop:1306 length:1236 start_codon:yes stop_codon:yes gene_type:complete
MYSSKVKNNLIFKLDNSISLPPINLPNDKLNDRKKLYKQNNYFLEKLNIQKNKIDTIYETDSLLWDEIKKFTNEYEFVYTNHNSTYKNISNIYPISRSYFKLWEIIHDFNLIKIADFSRDTKFRSVHIAEGPGGFIESIYKYITKYITNDFKDILIYGNTLLSNHSSIPKWKIKKNIQELYNIILNKNDDIGDLYNINYVDNIIKFNTDCDGNGLCNLVTADGGFDFSSNYNQQENNFLNLFVSEIYIILNILKEDSNAVIKIYDIFSKISIKLLYILQLFFDKIYITKPLTSRPANSEKYIICCNFKKNIKINFYLRAFKEIIQKNDISLIEDYNIMVDYDFIKSLIDYNNFYVDRQIYYIEKTLSIIEHIKNTNNINNREEVLNNYLRNLYNLNKNKCITWCKTYSISN